MKIKRLAARLFLIVILMSLLTPFACATEDDFRYSINFETFINDWGVKINGVTADTLSPSNPRLVLSEDDRVSLVLSLKEGNPYIKNGSVFLRFSSTEDGSTTTTHTRCDTLLLPDGTYVVFRPINETLAFDDFHLAEDRKSLNYSFSFSGEYNAVPVTFDEIRASESNINDTPDNLWNIVDSSSSSLMRIRASGQTDDPTPLSREFNSQWVSWDYVLTTQDGVTANYEVNTGDGWHPLEIASFRNESDNRQALFNGRNFIYESRDLVFETAYGEPTTFELIDPVTVGSVAVAAAAAAVGAAAVSSAASVTVSGSASSVSGSDSSISKPSILINGGGLYPSLVNTKKATVELLLNMDTNFGEIYKWTAFATVWDCPKAAIAAAVPPFGESSNAVIMISGEKLPKNKVSVFLEVAAIGFDGEKYTASAELTMYEKGLFADLDNKDRPGSPDSYKVTRVSDANLDGIAEVKILDPTDYIVELYDDRALIRAGDECVTVEL